MFEILPESTNTCIGVKVSGKLASKDYDVLVSKLDEAISAHGKINLLMVLGDFDGWDDLDAAKADYKLGTHQYSQVEKAAFVSDKKWQGWMVKILSPMTRHTKERYFEIDQLEDAWSWIKED